MKPVIYRPRRYGHLSPVICVYCLMHPSMGRTDSGELGCYFCQREVDKAIEAQFEVIEID